MSVVKNNDTVKVNYTGTFSNGEVFDTSKGREPLEFKVGAGQMIPGFEKAVLGMALDEVKNITIPAAEAYGEPNDEMLQKISKDQLPPDLKPEVGQELASTLPNGQQMIVKVAEVNEDSIVIDANHPLAGKDLNFEIQVMEIR